jgi:hypothetical protein
MKCEPIISPPEGYRGKEILFVAIVFKSPGLLNKA